MRGLWIALGRDRSKSLGRLVDAVDFERFCSLRDALLIQIDFQCRARALEWVRCTCVVLCLLDVMCDLCLCRVPNICKSTLQENATR